MNVRHYETLLLTSTDMSKDDVTALEKHMSTLVSDASGSVKSFDQWGKHRLAYPVRKSDYGNYILVRYSVSETTEFFSKMESLLKVKYNDGVMRHVHVALTPELFNSEYHRPEPIDSIENRERLDRASQAARGSDAGKSASEAQEAAPQAEAPADEKSEEATHSDVSEA